ncbi:MAG: response regulator [Deltaproteobacteria bacterium]|nr:response regulator [Deltaproteobacteria bacterium]
MTPIKKVLIADNDSAHTKELTLFFLREGYAVETARTTKEIIEMICNTEYHLILCDTTLPDTSVTALSSKVSMLKSNCKHLVFMGNNSGEELMELYKATGNPAFLKPVQNIILKKILAAKQ